MLGAVLSMTVMLVPSIFLIQQVRYNRLPRVFSATSGDNDSIGDKIVLNIKSGASVIHERLPVHFNNELGVANIPHITIYSDFADSIDGREVIDILSHVGDRVRSQHDFRAYKTLHERIRANESLHDIDGAWSLDKYKFLPMVRCLPCDVCHELTDFMHKLADSYRRYPDALWHVNIEADTYLFWRSLIRFLQPLTSYAQVFLGSPVKIDDIGCWFAHGGSGYVLSKGLMDITFGSSPGEFEHRLDDFSAYACCGDELLGRALYSVPGLKIKAPSDLSLDHFTGETPFSVRFNTSAFLICSVLLR